MSRNPDVFPFIVVVDILGSPSHNFQVPSQEAAYSLIKEWSEYMKTQPRESWHIRSFTGYPKTFIRFDMIMAMTIKPNEPTDYEKLVKVQAKVMESMDESESWRQGDE